MRRWDEAAHPVLPVGSRRPVRLEFPRKARLAGARERRETSGGEENTCALDKQPSGFSTPGFGRFRGVDRIAIGVVILDDDGDEDDVANWRPSRFYAEPIVSDASLSLSRARARWELVNDDDDENDDGYRTGACNRARDRVASDWRVGSSRGEVERQRRIVRLPETKRSAADGAARTCRSAGRCACP